MVNFSIEVPDSKSSSYTMVTGIVFLLNVLVFAWLSFAGEKSTASSLCIVGLALNLSALMLFFLFNKKNVFKKFRLDIIFIISAIIWAIIGKWLLAVLLIVFAVMGFFTNRKLNILFSDEGILYPSFPPRNIPWTEVSGVILKDDILTIDLKNNQLFQFSLENDAVEGLDAPKFNRYCREMLNSQ